MKKFFLFFLFFILCTSLVFAEKIKFTLNQSEYYFLVGEESVINLDTVNTYNKEISGMLNSTITQNVMQQGMQYSSTNTQVSTFIVNQGENSVGIGFGTSNVPLSLHVKLSFSFTEDKERFVELEDIVIYFVNENKEKKNKEEKMEDSSEESLSEELQNKLDEFFKEKKEEPKIDSSKLQNNQMVQDISALKTEMQKQMQDQEEMRQELEKKISESSKVGEMKKKLQDEGYNFTTMKTTNGLNNTLEFSLNYTNQNNESAQIKGEFKNHNITKLEIKKQEKKSNNYFLIIFTLMLISLILYFVNKKYMKKNNSNAFEEEKPKKPYDYLAESRNLLDKAKLFFEEKKYKDAYQNVGMGLRLFLSYNYNLNKELTNYELISYFKKNKINHKEIKECFDLCSLVEFAKYKANKTDFNKIIKIAEKKINIEN